MLINKYNKLVIIPFIFILFSTLLLKCTSSDNKVKMRKNSGNQLNISENKDVYKVKQVKHDAISDTFRTKQLIFFSLNKSEYKIQTKNIGVVPKFDFKNIFREFASRARAIKPILIQNKIGYKYSTASNFVFILQNKDTVLFNRINEDMIIGQLFFDGYQSPTVVEGLMENRELRDSIRKIFKSIIPEATKIDSIAEDTVIH